MIAGNLMCGVVTLRSGQIINIEECPCELEEHFDIKNNPVVDCQYVSGVMNGCVYSLPQPPDVNWFLHKIRP